MCIFYTKKLSCGCEIIACHFRRDKNNIIIGNHSYKWICEKCINLPDKVINDRLDDIKHNIYYNTIYCNGDYVYNSNGWTRTISSPFDYYINEDTKEFLAKLRVRE